MATEQVLTPSTAARPSRTTSPSSETGCAQIQTKTNAQLTDMSSPDDFKPFQLLLETEITLQYGKKLTKSKVIHEEILCCHSETAQALFIKARVLRDAYALADELRRQLKLFVYPRLSDKAFEEKHVEKKATPLIVRIYELYPLSSYRKSIQEVVDDVITEQVAKKHVTAPLSKAVLQKKDLKNLGIQLRLQGLHSRGVLAVAQRLSEKLRHIKHEENEASKSSFVKAAAQRRIILPNVEDRVIRSLVQWIYCQGTLTYEDAEHLYALHALAARLGMTQLAQQCLIKLSGDTEDMIRVAFSQGLTLLQLLDLGCEPREGGDQPAVPTGNVVHVVFGHVLKDSKPSSRLLKLVVDTLAKHLGPESWEKLEHMINHSVSLQLIRVILSCRYVKSEDVDRLSLKSESMFTGDEQALVGLEQS